MKRLWEPYAYSDAPRADCAWQLDTDWPQATGDLSTDIAIIGGGYTGLSAALHLAEAGEEVTVLDAKSPGWGASGRNGGFCCLGGADISDAALDRRHGPGGADAWFDTQRTAIDLVGDLLTRHGIEASRHSDGEVMLAHSRRAYRHFSDERDIFARRGVKAEILPPDALRERGLMAQGMHGGLYVPIGFALDPGAYASGLAKAAQKAGATLFADSPVLAVDRNSDSFKLTLPNGILHATRVLVATNGYSSENIPTWLRARTMPIQSSVVITRSLSRAEQHAQGWTSDLMAYDSRNLLHYFRRLPDGRFLFGMRGGLNATPATDARIRKKIHDDFRKLFPAWANVDIEHFWSGLVNYTRRFTPYIGPIPGMKSAWIAMGYHGNGVAMASYSGVIAASLIRDKAPDLPFPQTLQTPLARFPFGPARRSLTAAGMIAAGLDDLL